MRGSSSAYPLLLSSVVVFPSGLGCNMMDRQVLLSQAQLQAVAADDLARLLIFTRNPSELRTFYWAGLTRGVSFLLFSIFL